MIIDELDGESAIDYAEAARCCPDGRNNVLLAL